jgi:hypothetical protein
MLKANDGSADVLEIQRADGAPFTEIPSPNVPFWFAIYG